MSTRPIVALSVLATLALVGCKPLSPAPVAPAPSEQTQPSAVNPSPAAPAVGEGNGGSVGAPVAPQPTPPPVAAEPPANDPAPARAPSSYTPYTKAAFERARAAGQPIVLFFFATWCPTCRVQEPLYQSVYASGELADLGVQAFRVNFNDSDTDADEKALASAYGITYQHTFVLLNAAGTEVGRTFGHRSAEQVKADARKTQ